MSDVLTKICADKLVHVMTCRLHKSLIEITEKAKVKSLEIDPEGELTKWLQRMKWQVFKGMQQARCDEQLNQYADKNKSGWRMARQKALGEFKVRGFKDETIGGGVLRGE